MSNMTEFCLGKNKLEEGMPEVSGSVSLFQECQIS